MNNTNETLTAIHQVKAIDSLLQAIEHYKSAANCLKMFSALDIKLKHTNDVAYYNSKEINEIMATFAKHAVELENETRKLHDVINAINYDVAETIYNNK